MEGGVERSVGDLFSGAKAHHDDRSAGIVASPGGCLQEIRCIGAIGLDQDDFCQRGDGMNPLDIQGDLGSPTRIAGGIACAAALVDFREETGGLG